MRFCSLRMLESTKSPVRRSLGPSMILDLLNRMPSRSTMTFLTRSVELKVLTSLVALEKKYCRDLEMSSSLIKYSSFLIKAPNLNKQQLYLPMFHQLMELFWLTETF